MVKPKKLDIEKEAELIHSERCGGIAGTSMRFRGSLVRLSIYRDFLVLSHFKKVVLKFDEIESTELKSNTWKTWGGLCIYHNRRDVGEIVLSHMGNSDRIKALLNLLI